MYSNTIYGISPSKTNNAFLQPKYVKILHFRFVTIECVYIIYTIFDNCNTHVYLVFTYATVVQVLSSTFLTGLETIVV